MTDLVAVVRATRASARSLNRCQRLAREALDIDAMQNDAERRADPVRARLMIIVRTQRAQVKAAMARAAAAYDRAQAILAANPLPGDVA